MTKSVLVLPSDLYKEAERAKQLEQELASRDTELANSKALIAALQAQLAEAQSKIKE